MQANSTKDLMSPPSTNGGTALTKICAWTRKGILSSIDVDSRYLELQLLHYHRLYHGPPPGQLTQISIEILNECYQNYSFLSLHAHSMHNTFSCIAICVVHWAWPRSSIGYRWAWAWMLSPALESWFHFSLDHAQDVFSFSRRIRDYSASHLRYFVMDTFATCYFLLISSEKLPSFPCSLRECWGNQFCNKSKIQSSTYIQLVLFFWEIWFYPSTQPQCS